MAVIYTTAVKDARLTAVVTSIGATGVLEVGTTGMATILFSVNLNNPAGTAAAARIRTATGGTNIVTGLTVGTSGTDVIVNTTTVALSDPVSVTSATITHAA